MEACYIIVKPGAGGDNTKHQAETMTKMILKSCQNHSFNVSIEDVVRVEGRGCL